MNARKYPISASVSGSLGLRSSARCASASNLPFPPQRNGRKRSEAVALEVKFEIADAENLPYSDEEFDDVVSTFGVMFAPDQQQVARELIRVCRSEDKIGLANWTPEGFIGNLFKTLGGHVTPPAGVLSPALWGKRDWTEETFDGVSSTHTI